MTRAYILNLVLKLQEIRPRTEGAMEQLGRVIGLRLIGQQARLGSVIAARANRGQVIVVRRSFASKASRTNVPNNVSKLGYLLAACGASAVCFTAYKYFDLQSRVYALKSKKVSQVMEIISGLKIFLFFTG